LEYPGKKHQPVATYWQVSSPRPYIIMSNYQSLY
jgi:hypothetical protein